MSTLRTVSVIRGRTPVTRSLEQRYSLQDTLVMEPSKNSGLGLALCGPQPGIGENLDIHRVRYCARRYSLYSGRYSKIFDMTYYKCVMTMYTMMVINND
jgi:hypothetical protein